jgi:RNA polymerase sigma-70 factor (ECF subfamily)
LEASQTQDRLAVVLQQLDEQPRQIVSLKFFGGLTNRAIAGLLGLTESNVAVILFRSVRRMRKDFSNAEADHG